MLLVGFVSGLSAHKILSQGGGVAKTLEKNNTLTIILTARSSGQLTQSFSFSIYDNYVTKQYSYVSKNPCEFVKTGLSTQFLMCSSVVCINCNIWNKRDTIIIIIGHFSPGELNS